MNLITFLFLDTQNLLFGKRMSVSARVMKAKIAFCKDELEHVIMCVTKGFIHSYHLIGAMILTGDTEESITSSQDAFLIGAMILTGDTREGMPSSHDAFLIGAIIILTDDTKGTYSVFP